LGWDVFEILSEMKMVTVKSEGREIKLTLIWRVFCHCFVHSGQNSNK
jgi:hypothetical protein